MQRCGRIDKGLVGATMERADPPGTLCPEYSYSIRFSRRGFYTTRGSMKASGERLTTSVCRLSKLINA